MAVLLAAAWGGASARPADRGAVASGVWSEAATWTGGVVPTASDRVFIGSTYPTGAAATATVSLT